MSTAPDALGGDCLTSSWYIDDEEGRRLLAEEMAELDRLEAEATAPEYECRECHRMWPSPTIRDGCCTWDDA